MPLARDYVMTKRNSAPLPPTPEFSHPVQVLDLDMNVENRFKIKAEPDECAALAQRLDIVAIETLSAQLTLFPKKGGRVVIVYGELNATVTQTCVVSLEPFITEIPAAIDLVFAEEAAEQGREPKGVDVDEGDQDLPEPIEDGQIDLGELAAQQLSLELDPFPRAPGVDFSAEYKDKQPKSTPSGEADERENPFAVLASLKDKLK